MEQDLSNQSPIITTQPEDVRRDIAAMGRQDSFFLGKVILGYKDMTERCHGPMCVFQDLNPSQYKLALVPRDHFKTSVITITGTIKGVVNNPNGRFLIANEASTNSQRMLRAIRQHAESNKIFRSIYSEIIPKDTRAAGLRWNDSELDFVRDWIGPEPTIDTTGMTGAFVSRHYTHITADDMISEEAVKSPKVMDDTITRFKGFLSLLVRPETDTIMVVGTRWALNDIYSWILKYLAPRLAVYATGVYSSDGEPIFPELMGHEILDLKRRAMGEYKFSCLYLNNPRNEDVQDLNVNDAKRWRWADAAQTAIELLNDSDEVERTVLVSALDVTTTVDLAPAETQNSDMNAVVTVGQTPWGELVVLDAWGKRCKPSELIEKIFTVYRRWRPRVVGIEAVAYQKAFKYFLRDECERRMIYLNIRDIKAIGRKETRIRGLQPIMAAGRLYLPGGASLLRNQMSEFPLGEHDDVVDGLSMHLQLLRGQLSPESIARRQSQVNAVVQQIVDPTGSEAYWANFNPARESSAIYIPGQ